MTSLVPEDRIGLEDIPSHPWFQESCISEAEFQSEMNERASGVNEHFLLLARDKAESLRNLYNSDYQDRSPISSPAMAMLKRFAPKADRLKQLQKSEFILSSDFKNCSDSSSLEEAPTPEPTEEHKPSLK